MTIVGGTQSEIAPKCRPACERPIGHSGCDDLRLACTIANAFDGFEDVLRQSGAAAKRSTGAMGKDFLVNVLDAMPAPLSELLQRSVKMPGIGLVVSSLRGPDVPLYMAGARMVAHLPISLVLDGMALNCTGFSHNGTL